MTEIKQCFWKVYEKENGNLVGVEDAFHWWINPGRACLVEIAGRGGKRCKAQCQTCSTNVQTRGY